MHRKKITISVLMPTHNRATYIGIALNSVLDQLEEKDEIVIIDDGSTDDTESVVQPFLNDPRVRYIKKDHTTLPDTRNTAVNNSSNAWIIWVDSDDILVPGALKKYRQYVAHYPNVDVFYCNYHVIDAEGIFIKTVKFIDFYKKNDYLVQKLIYHNRIPQGGTLVKRDVFDRYGMFDLFFVRREDYEFWVRVARYLTFKNIGGYLYKWRWHQWNRAQARQDHGKKYSALLLDKMLRDYSLQEFFPYLDWKDEKQAFAGCYFVIGGIYLKWKSYPRAVTYFLKSLNEYENNDTLVQLLVSLEQIPHGERELLRQKIPHQYMEKAQNLALTRWGRGYLEKYRIASINKQMKHLSLAGQKFTALKNRLEGKTKYQPLLSGVFFHLGEIDYQGGNFHQAEQFFMKTLKLNPSHQKASEYLKEINQKLISKKNE